MAASSQFLDPNGVYAGPTNWTVSAGETNAATATDDALRPPSGNPETGGAGNINSSTNGATVTLDVGTWTKPAGAVISAVRAWAYGKGGHATRHNIVVRLLDGANGNAQLGTNEVAGVGYQGTSSAWFQSADNTTDLAQAQIDALRVQVLLNETSSTTGVAYVYEVCVEIVYWPLVSNTDTPSGGPTAGGSIAAESWSQPVVYNDTAPGAAITVGGSVSAEQKAYGDEPAGGPTAGGSTAEERVADDSPAAGPTATGSTDESLAFDDSPPGAAQQVSGTTSDEQRVYDETVTGGVTVGGEVAAESWQVIVPSRLRVYWFEFETWVIDAYTDAPSGGPTVHGSRVEGRAAADAPAGGPRASGSVVEGVAHLGTPSGGPTAGGSLDEVWQPPHVESDEATGGPTAGGSTDESASYDDAPSGGPAASGSVSAESLERQWNDTPSGGVTVEGSAEEVWQPPVVYDDTTGDATVTVGGSVSESWETAGIYSDSPAGAPIAGGAVVEELTRESAPAGGPTCTGSVVESVEYSDQRTGGPTVGGSVIETFETAGPTYTDTPTGGVTVTGLVVEAAAYADAPSGAPVAQGSATGAQSHSANVSGGPTVTGTLTSRTDLPPGATVRLVEYASATVAAVNGKSATVALEPVASDATVTLRSEVPT